MVIPYHLKIQILDYDSVRSSTQPNLSLNSKSISLKQHFLCCVTSNNKLIAKRFVENRN